MLTITHNHALSRWVACLNIALHPPVRNIHVLLAAVVGELLLSLFEKESRVKGSGNWEWWVMGLNNMEGITTERATTVQIVELIAMPLTIANGPPWPIGTLLSHNTRAKSILTVTNLPLAVDTDRGCL